MSITTSGIILFLSMLIQASLQLSHGTFAMLYHYVSGKKSRKKADQFSLYYILGIEFFTAFILVITYFILSAILYSQSWNNNILTWVIIGVFIAEAIVSLFLYYRKSKATTLFISRKLSHSIETHCKSIKDGTDATALGFVAMIPELIFSLPLYIIYTIELTKIPPSYHGPLILLYIIATILPLFIIFILYHCGYNLATIERLRTKLKPYVRIVISLSYILIAAIIFNTGVLQNGQ